MFRALLAAALTLAGIIAITPAASTDAALDDTPWRIPEPPRRCTTAEADSGDVAGCVLIAYRDPSTTGWGAPPAPGVGDGWNWRGYTYNGSPALADWEATYIAENTDPVAGFRPGYLETHRFAQPLFEGFLDEISANGYDVGAYSGYSFRCTNSNGGWSCPSGDPDDLSNHAWGLAIDMNAGTNPIRRYSGIDGATACQTPIETDLPKWVVETAERWGLYWGGYGFSSGCSSATTQRTTVFRDPPHFEFRGTPEQAAAIAAFNLGNDPRRRCWDTIDDDGDLIERCNVTGTPEAGWRMPVEVEAPDGAAAAVINLAVALPSGPGHLTLEDCGPTSGERSTASLNFGTAETAAAMAIVPLVEGRFCIHQITDTHTIVDVVGYLTDTGERFWYEPVPSMRLLDTRHDEICEGDECTTSSIGDLSSRTVPTEVTAPRIVNLAIAEALGPGHARVGRCDVVDTADVSNINYIGGGARSNLALMDDGPEGSCAWVHRDTHVVVDELGRLDDEVGLGWQIGGARRVLDTRLCDDVWCEGAPIGGEAVAVDLGLTAPGAAVTVAIAGATSPGHAFIGNCDDLVDGHPTTANVNYGPGAATANMAIVAPDDGVVCVYVHSTAHVIVDVLAELVVEQTLGLVPVTPHRVHDTRLDER